MARLEFLTNPPPLHFVHDTPLRPSVPIQNRQREEVVSIRQHIKQHNRRRRRERTKQPSASLGKPTVPIGWLHRSKTSSLSRVITSDGDAHDPCNSDASKVAAAANDAQTAWSLLSERIKRNASTVIKFHTDFLQTSGLPLTRDEQILLGNYSVSKPQVFAGNHSKGPFCAWRDLQWRVALQFPLRLEWMLMLAEFHTSPGPPSSSFFSRKVKAYRRLNEALVNQAQRVSDETLDLVICAVLMDSAMSSPEVGQTHLLGLYRLIQYQGGLVSLFNCASVMYHPIMIVRYFLSAPLITSEYADPQSAARFLVSDMRQKTSKRSMLNRTYPALREILRSSWPSTRLHERRLYFATVYLLLLILNICRDSASYLSHLDALVQACGSRLTSSGVMVTKLAALPGLIGKSWIDVSHSHFSSDRSPSELEVDITESFLEGIKVFSLLEPLQQSEITSQLAILLLGEF